MIHIPRVDQEVIVDFLEGDPDQPIIIGSVYNAREMPPYSLPDCKTQSGIKSRSSKNGTADNFNEFRFEDKKGEEEVYLHAEKNWTIMVENDKGQTVGHDETLTVKNDRSKTVVRDEKTKIGNNKTDDIGQVLKITAGDKIDAYATKNVVITAGVDLTLNGPGGMIKIDASGITIQGVLVKIN
jgi:type VI secretion system secreted protein VgrG